MVFQQFNLFPHMTALQNCIEAPMQVLGLSREEAEERALDLLNMVGMTAKKDQHPTPPVWRATTAGSHCPCLGDAAQDHVVG